MSRPPWVWNSAPVTLMACKGGCSRVPASVRAAAASQPISAASAGTSSARGARRRRPRRPRSPERSGPAPAGGRRTRSRPRRRAAPAPAARLRSSPRSRRGSAGLGIDLDAAFHHQRPGDQRALRHRPRAMALAAAQVGQARAQRAAPGDGAAVVAGVAGEDRVAHRRQQFGHHRRVAAEAVAGQQQHAAGQVLGAAVGALVADAEHAAAVVAPQLAHQGLGDVTAPACWPRRPAPPSAPRRCAAAACACGARRVAGVEKAVQQLEGRPWRCCSASIAGAMAWA
jgi:hypothetical protein